MTRILLLATLALTLLALAACGGDAGPEELEEDEAAADTPTTGETATGDGPPSITFDLEERNDSSQYGRATLTDMGEGQTRVVLELFEGPDNVQPAHIHSGTCDEVGEIVIPLESAENGRSDTRVDRPLDELIGSDYVINVHESEQALENQMVCSRIPDEA